MIGYSGTVDGEVDRLYIGTRYSVLNVLDEDVLE
jgi:hypothetical protein